MIPFDQWWEGKILWDADGGIFTRKSLIEAVAETDGGAHVDVGLPSTYHRLTRMKRHGYYLSHTDSLNPEKRRLEPMRAPHLVSIRQIGHEVLRTVLPMYGYDGKANYPGTYIGGAYFTIRRGSQVL
jgi:hypothetical protein